MDKNLFLGNYFLTVFSKTRTQGGRPAGEDGLTTAPVSASRGKDHPERKKESRKKLAAAALDFDRRGLNTVPQRKNAPVRDCATPSKSSKRTIRDLRHDAPTIPEASKHTCRGTHSGPFGWPAAQRSVSMP